MFFINLFHFLFSVSISREKKVVVDITKSLQGEKKKTLFKTLIKFFFLNHYKNNKNV
jgi:hypothetical protein